MENKDISKSGLTKVLQMMNLSNFGFSFISIFIPIYLLTIGDPHNVYFFKDVMVWLVIQHSSLLFFCFVAIYFSNRVGIVKTLHVRFLLLPLYILLLSLLPFHSFLFYVIPIVIGAEAAFYWTALNILFLRNTNKETMGRSLGKFFAYPKLFTIFNSLIAATVVHYFGFTTLFTISLFFVGLAFIPVASLTSEKTYFVFTLKAAKDLYYKNKRFLLPEIIDNLTEDAAVIWSIFVYLKLASIVDMGIIGTLVSVATICFTIFLGKRTDKENKYKQIKLGAVLVVASWLLCYVVGVYAVNKYLFYVATIGISLAMKVFLVPYQVILLNEARKDDAQFIVMREIPVVLGRVILFLMAIIFNNNLPFLFLIVAVLFVYFIFLNTKKLVSVSIK